MLTTPGWANQLDYHPIQFEPHDTILTEDGEKTYSALLTLMEEEENLTLGLYGQIDEHGDSLLAVERRRIIYFRLINDGIYRDRISFLPCKNTADGELTSCVGYAILSFDYFPCTSGSVINFTKGTSTVVETRCDSIRFIYEYMQIHPEDNFTIIGVFTERNDRPNPESNLLISRKMALSRAKKIRKALIAMGIDKKRLKISTAYHKPPTVDDHHDWPFYPEHFSYEIGVYCLPEQ